MSRQRRLALAVAALLSAALVLAAGSSGADVAVKRTMPNGKTDVIKAMGAPL
jgi:hypothetical protein